MKIDQVLEDLNLSRDQVDIVVEPETSFKKLNEYEEKYNRSSQEIYNLVEKQGVKNEVLDEWAYYYMRFLRYGGDESDLYYNQCFFSSQNGQGTYISQPDQGNTADQVFLCA